ALASAPSQPLFFFQAEDGIRDRNVTGVQTCALPIFMSDAGSALMGIGSARGEHRAAVASEMAVSSPLLEASIEGARGVLLTIAGGSDLGLQEINEAAGLVADVVHEEANLIFGAVVEA